MEANLQCSHRRRCTWSLVCEIAPHTVICMWLIYCMGSANQLPPPDAKTVPFVNCLLDDKGCKFIPNVFVSIKPACLMASLGRIALVIVSWTLKDHVLCSSRWKAHTLKDKGKNMIHAVLSGLRPDTRYILSGLCAMNSATRRTRSGRREPQPRIQRDLQRPPIMQTHQVYSLSRIETRLFWFKKEKVTFPTITGCLLIVAGTIGLKKAPYFPSKVGAGASDSQSLTGEDPLVNGCNAWSNVQSGGVRNL